MFVNWKLTLTIIIVLIVMASFLTTNASVSNFFSFFNQKIGNVVDIDRNQRTVEFSLILDSYNNMSFGNSRSMNISIFGDTKATIQQNRLQVNKSLTIIDFKGSGSIGDELSLEGTFEKADWTDASIVFNSPINLQSSYVVATFNALSVKSIDMNTTGILSLKGSETTFSGRITIDQPVGRFVFDRTNGTRLFITGYANKITIPNAGINVS